MNSRDLISIARRLADGSVSGHSGRPRQTDLCRAVSDAYYALFHALARCCADMLAGSAPTNRDRSAWRQTYRSLEHGLARNQCSNRVAMSRFPVEIQRFGETFVTMQRLRHQADYDPEMGFARSRVTQLIDRTEDVIAVLNTADRGQRRAFAIYVLFRARQ